jgi:hypothetical protein
MILYLASSRSMGLLLQGLLEILGRFLFLLGGLCI